MTTKKIILAFTISLVICMTMYTLFEMYGNNEMLIDAVGEAAIFTTINLVGLGLTLRYMVNENNKATDA